MDRYKQIKQILRKHDYEVILYTTTLSNFLTVFLPKRKDFPQIKNPFSINYLYDELVYENGIIVDVQEDEYPTFLYSPKYSIPEVTISDIFSACNKIRYNTDLASFFIDAKEVTKSEFRQKFFSINLNKEEKALKSNIESIVSIAEEEGFNSETENMAHDMGVYESYSIIKEIYAEEI